MKAPWLRWNPQFVGSDWDNNKTPFSLESKRKFGARGCLNPELQNLIFNFEFLI
jgi:hypothetical protein